MVIVFGMGSVGLVSGQDGETGMGAREKALLDEIRAQQVRIEANMKRIEADVEQIQSDIRQARIFSRRGGGGGASQ